MLDHLIVQLARQLLLRPELRVEHILHLPELSINAATGAINLATSTPGTYTITYSFHSGACSKTATTSITITALPTATIFLCWSVHIVQRELQLLHRPELQGERIQHLQELSSMQQLEQLILQLVHLELILSHIHLQLEHVVTRQQLQYTITALPTATIAYSGSAILRNRNCNCNSNGNSRWNIYCTCGSCNQCCNWCDKSCNKYSWNLYNYLFIYSWCM